MSCRQLMLQFVVIMKHNKAILSDYKLRHTFSSQKQKRALKALKIDFVDL